jgi:molecular chaperone GrpE
VPDFFEGLRVNDFNQPQPHAAADPNLDGTPALDAALAAAEAKATENRDNYLRSVAEFENFRKRMERELDNARKYAVERFAQELVGVGDSLEAGIAAGSSNPGPALLEGAQATLKQLHNAFEKAGIKVIDPAGQPPNTVLNVIQKGYSLNGRLLRPARVIVSKSPGGDN